MDRNGGRSQPGIRRPRARESKRCTCLATLFAFRPPRDTHPASNAIAAGRPLPIDRWDDCVLDDQSRGPTRSRAPHRGGAARPRKCFRAPQPSPQRPTTASRCPRSASADNRAGRRSAALPDAPRWVWPVSVAIGWLAATIVLAVFCLLCPLRRGPSNWPGGRTAGTRPYLFFFFLFFFFGVGALFFFFFFFFSFFFFFLFFFFFNTRFFLPVLFLLQRIGHPLSLS